ncbi:MAG: hypothetical protein ABJA86_13620 [Nocardioidaceae bacterium]
MGAVREATAEVSRLVGLGSGQERLLKYLRSRVGQVVQGDELASLAIRSGALSCPEGEQHVQRDARTLERQHADRQYRSTRHGLLLRADQLAMKGPTAYFLAMDARVIAAIVGAAATLAVAGIGFWQWRRSGSNDQRNAYGQERVETLRQLWNNLSSLEEASRVNRVTPEGFTVQMQALNNFLNLKAPLLRSDEQEWARECVRNLQEIETILEAQPPLSPDDEEWMMTGPLSLADSPILAAYRVYTKNREVLSERYKACLHGKYL